MPNLRWVRVGTLGDLSDAWLGGSEGTGCSLAPSPCRSLARSLVARRLTSNPISAFSSHPPLTTPSEMFSSALPRLATRASARVPAQAFAKVCQSIPA